jgi:purine-binding chemotaxis protein CheW
MTDDRQRVEEKLRERARSLAQVPETDIDYADVLEAVEFTLSGERYALGVEHISESLPLREFTRVPGTPSFVVGIVNVRGQIISLIDLRTLLEVPDSGLSDQNRIIVLRSREMEFGILADRITGSVVLPRAALQPPPQTLSEINRDVIIGVTPDRLIVLDGARFLIDPRLVFNEEDQREMVR